VPLWVVECGLGVWHVCVCVLCGICGRGWQGVCVCVCVWVGGCLCLCVFAGVFVFVYCICVDDKKQNWRLTKQIVFELWPSSVAGLFFSRSLTRARALSLPSLRVSVAHADATKKALYLCLHRKLFFYTGNYYLQRCHESFVSLFTFEGSPMMTTICE
jgi:hypothetical protein